MKSIKKQYKTPISKNVYDDIRGKLKYLFWIDIDELIKDIKNSEEYSDFQKAPSNDLKKLEKLFDKLFDKIFKYCGNYTKFLDNPGCCQLFFDYDTLHPLDGNPPTDKKGIYNYNIFFLFKEALKNHLIIHSFLSFTNESNQKKYSLSFKNELELQKALDGKKFSIAYNQDHNNFFTRRKKRYRDDSENLLYSHQILNDICQVNDDSTFETNTSNSSHAGRQNVFPLASSRYILRSGISMLFSLHHRTIACSCRVNFCFPLSSFVLILIYATTLHILSSIASFKL